MGQLDEHLLATIRAEIQAALGVEAGSTGAALQTSATSLPAQTQSVPLLALPRSVSPPLATAQSGLMHEPCFVCICVRWLWLCLTMCLGPRGCFSYSVHGVAPVVTLHLSREH